MSLTLSSPFFLGTKPTPLSEPKFVILAYVMYNLFVLLQRLTEESMITRRCVQKVTIAQL